MKKRFGILVLVALLVVGITSMATAKEKVGVIFSIGGLGDQSFNDSAFHGMERAKKDFDIEAIFMEPADIAEMEDHQRALAQDGYGLIIGVGFLQEGAMADVSQDYPKTKFAIVDSVVDGPNVASLLFKEHEGSFLVGYLAGKMSKSNTVGFVGGMESPVIKRFEGGFVQGVQYANPNARVIINYAGSFADPGRGKELAISQNERGADIVYHASGGTGNGVIEAAKEKGFYAIGVDSDQDHLAPGIILTSMVKRVDVAVYELVRNFVEGKFEAGVHNFGIAEGGVDTSTFEYTSHIVPEGLRNEIEELKAKIISGEIKVADPNL